MEAVALRVAHVDRDPVLYYTEGWKYRTNRVYHFKLAIVPKAPIDLPFLKMDMDGVTTVLVSYAWNGASGPTWDTKNSMVGSLIHDIIYQLIRLGLIDAGYKEYGDNVLHDVCSEDGMWEWRADYWRWAVLTYGQGSCRPSSEPPELMAP
jgi:hypothetical protein